MRQRLAIFLFVSGLLTALVLLLGPSLVGDSTPVVKWKPADEVEVASANEEVDPTEAQALIQRVQVPQDANGNVADRMDVVLRGRIVNHGKVPVRDAKVWLDFSRGGRGGGGGNQRRVPEPVQTDGEGRFAFSGQAFRNLRVTLMVAHPLHAAKSFDRNIGEAKADNDVGDLVVDDGGELFGRVTDLDGNGIAAAEVRLQPENDNPLRMQRDREQFLPPQNTDNNGYYRFEHVSASAWAVAASAPRHVSGTSTTVVAEENTRVDVPDIRLGPGYELSGVVNDTLGKPVAGADVVARSQQPADGNPGGGRGGRGGRGQGGPGQSGPGQGGPGQGGFGFNFGQGGNNDHRTKTDEQGRFTLDHLPGAPLELTVTKDGYLRYQQKDIDAKLGKPLFITLLDGLKILGLVTDAKNNAPVSKFGVRSMRIRNLPAPGETPIDMGDLVARFRAGTLDDATIQSARGQMDNMRGMFDAMRGNFGGRGGRGPNNGNAQNGGQDPAAKPTAHPDGRFIETGLEEGVYLVQIDSPNHAGYRSGEVTVRNGAPSPEITVALQSGVSLEGVVVQDDGKPIAEARVELRAAEENGRQTADASANGGRGGRGGNNGGRDMVQMFMGMLAGSTLEATTDSRGQFVFPHVMPGRYRVTASKDGHDDGRTDPFVLNADTKGVKLTLGSLASISGKIRGASPEQLAEARVMAIQVSSSGNNGQGGGGRGGMRGRGGPGGGGPFGVVMPDGTYRVTDLQPGGYVVRAFVGSGMRSMWQQFGGFGGFGGGGGGNNGAPEQQPDVTVRVGEAATLDIDLTIPQVGIVSGSVLHNGQPAAGFQVALRRQDTGNAATDANGQNNNQNGGGRGGRGGRGGPGGGNTDFNAAISSTGRFKINDVPAGNYQLVITSGRRAGTLHSEAVVVVTGTTSEVTVSLMTCSLEGEVTVDDGTKVEELQGFLMLLPGATEVPENMGQIGRDGTSFNARVQAGKFAVEMLPPGNYLAVLRMMGREGSNQQTFAQLGQKTVLKMPAGKKTENAVGVPGMRGGNGAPGAPGAPGANANGNSGGRGARGARGANGAPTDPNAPNSGQPQAPAARSNGGGRGNGGGGGNGGGAGGGGRGNGSGGGRGNNAGGNNAGGGI